MWLATRIPLTAWWEKWSPGLRLQWPLAFCLCLSCTYLSTSSRDSLVTKSYLTLATPWSIACQAPLSMGFSKQEYWSGLPFPSPMYESEKWEWSHAVVSYSSRPHGLQPTRLLCPWDFPGKSTGMGCHCLLLAFAWIEVLLLGNFFPNIFNLWLVDSVDVKPEAMECQLYLTLCQVLCNFLK